MTKPCTLCGRCCTNVDFMERISFSPADLARWAADGRDDILAQVGALSGWRESGACPFVVSLGTDRYGCTIYDTRPETCREYPMAVPHMLFVDCEMLEPGDTDQHVAEFMGRSAPAHPVEQV